MICLTYKNELTAPVPKVTLERTIVNLFLGNDLCGFHPVTNDSLRANRYKIFSVAALGTFMATLDGSIVNVALPSIANSLQTTVDTVAWVVLAYSLTLISLMLIFGAWTQVRGYLFAYKFGFIFFIVGSALCSFAPSIHTLIASRVIQAIGTAMFAAVGPGLVTTVFPTEERGKALGLTVMMVAAGFMIGPPLGGFMLKFWSWHSIFIFNIPIGLFGFFYVYRYFGALTSSGESKPLNLAGGIAVAVCLVSFVLALTFANDYAWSDPRIWGLFIVSVLAAMAFLRFESNPATSLIGLELFRNRTFVASMLAALVGFMAMSGVLVLMPFYLEQVRGLGPQQVGMFLIILPIMMFIFSPLSGRLSDRIGSRILTSAGMILTAVGLGLFLRVTATSPLTNVALALTVLGGGVGLFSTPNSSAMMGAVTPQQRAVASGILATNRNIGMSVGVALSTTLFMFFQSKYADLGDSNLIFIKSYYPVIYASIGLALLGLLFCQHQPPAGLSQSGPDLPGGPPLPPAA